MWSTMIPQIIRVEVRHWHICPHPPPPWPGFYVVLPTQVIPPSDLFDFSLQHRRPPAELNSIDRSVYHRTTTYKTNQLISPWEVHLKPRYGLTASCFLPRTIPPMGSSADMGDDTNLINMSEFQLERQTVAQVLRRVVDLERHFGWRAGNIWEQQ